MDDLDVNELVHDISHDCVIHRFWDVTEEPPATTNIKRPATGVESNGSKKEDIPVRQLYILLETLSGKLDKMDTLIEDKVCAIITPMNEKLATMEKELQKMKEKDCADDRKEDANSIANENAEVNSKEMSWMVEINSTSHDGLPTQRVVKKPRNASKKSGNVVDDKKKMAEKKLKNKIKVPHLLDNASGEDTWSDPVQREKSKKLGDRLDALADFARKLNKYTSPTPSSPQHKRQTKLVLSQLFSFVGNSTVKRIITSVTPSVSAYDLFSAVDDEKMRKLLNFLLDKENDLDKSFTSSTEFYRVIITLRNQWSSHNYGWLTNMHMWSAMKMFYMRSLSDPSPYHSQCLAFLDQWVVIKIVEDFKQFNPKTWKVTDTYKRIFNGTYPADRVTNKKWFHDIDHLYACHFVHKDHWVALDIDLKNTTVTVYDIILTVIDDNEMRNNCRPFAKMIPAIMNAMVPTAVRTKSGRQFTVRRLKSVPRNDNPGDCGVYTINFIECLALGCTFEGLSDEIIQDVRRKRAAEIYDAVGEPPITDLTLNTQNTKEQEKAQPPGYNTAPQKAMSCTVSERIREGTK
ncbi:hypothetical protein YC2023_050311 [Brassica napus]